MAQVVEVVIHSEINEFPTLKKYDVNIKISELKKKLELITGANHTSMKITMSINDKPVGELDDNETLLHYTKDQSGEVKLFVKDEQPSDLLSGDVPKYTISEEKYKERPNNVRNFIKEMREKQQSPAEKQPSS